MIELSNKDIEIIKSHSREFLQPLLTIMELNKLHLPEAELIKNENFNRVISQIIEFDRQGYKLQFITFVNIVMEGVF